MARKSHQRPNRKTVFTKKIEAKVSPEHFDKIIKCQQTLNLPTISDTIRYIIDTWQDDNIPISN